MVETIKEWLPPVEHTYTPINVDARMRVIQREGCLSEFAALVRYVTTTQVAKNSKGIYPMKGALSKLVNTLDIEEVCDVGGSFATPKQARAAEDFRVGLPLCCLAIASDMVGYKMKGTLEAEENAVQLLALAPHALARQLFADYMKSDYINERTYIRGITYARYAFRSATFSKSREILVEMIKTLPLGKFVRYEEFDRYMRTEHQRFLYEDDYDRFAVHYTSRYGNGQDVVGTWDNCHKHILRMMLSFLNVIGIVDLAYVENTPFLTPADECSDRVGVQGDFCVGIGAIRLTQLGAWILGLVEEYDGPVQEGIDTMSGGLVVTPDFTIIVSGLKARLAHERYLSLYLRTLDKDDNVVRFSLDFASLVKAFHSGLEPENLLEYLSKASDAPIPSNVEHTLLDYQAKTRRIRMRNVTILETDDEALLLELSHLKGIGEYKFEKISSAAVIDGDDEAKIATLIEKNGFIVRKLGE